MSILYRLFVLVAVALLPAVALQAWDEFYLRRAHQVEVQNHALSLAKLAAAEQQQIVQGIRQVLVALSELPAIKARDSVACNAYLAAMKRRFPAFLTFLIVDMSGQTFCDTNDPHTVVNVAKRGYFRSALRTGTFTVGKFSVGLSLPRKVIQFALPFYSDNGHIGGVIIAALSLDWLADHIAQKRPPMGAEIAILDRNGTYLAAYPENDRFVARKMPDKQNLGLDHGSTVDMRDLDGVERIVGFAPLGGDSGGLLVSYGLDKTRSFAAIEERTQYAIVMIVLSVLLVLVLTSLGARRFIHRPIGQLVDAANQWRLGNFTRRVSIRERSEIGRLAEAFNTMADALDHRERELSKAKDTAEEAAARITMIFESTTDAVLIVDREWRVSFLNARAKAVADGRDIKGMNIWEALPDATDPKIAQPLREALSEQRPITFEALCVRMNVWFAINAFPSSQGLTIFLRNVTEQKRAIEARRQIEERLHQSQKIEAIGQLTGGVAHDFNNLLTLISANLELIADRPETDCRVRRLAEAALHAADRGAKLTAQLLAFSRRQRLKPKFVNANEVIRDFQGLIRQAVGEGCDVKLLYDEGLWLCHVDPPLLQTALLNLALNGRDAMPDGGTLDIETRNVILDEGPLDGCLPGSYVRLSVTDNGCGISPEMRDRIFEPFFTTKEVGKGTGLGLSMVYGFVRQSGGHVAVDSVVGEGTTVSLYLPQATQVPDSEAEGVQSRARPTGSERILVVEDDERLLQITSEMLTEFGYQVVSARNGAEAIQLLESGRKFDLMFSDVVMPFGMSGVELGREARRLSKGIKVLLTSGYAEDVLQRLAAVDEFPIIDKPFRSAELAHRIRSILSEA